MKTQTSSTGGTAARPCRRRSRRPQKLALRSCGLSDVGYERPRNEDRFDLDDSRRVYVVADGIGSCKHGNVAAQIAVASILESIRHDSDSTARSERLEPAIHYAHSRICEAGCDDPSLQEMGTTVVGLLFDDQGSATVAHAGDSRAYRLRGGKLELLTRDHTFAARMVAAGHLREDDVDNGPWSNVLTRALSVEGPLEVETTITSVRDGDCFLLCSDGLTKMLSDADIRDCLKRGGGPEATCNRLIGEALTRGGDDNVTAIVIEIGRPGKHQRQDDDTQTVTIEIPLVTDPSAGVAPAVC